MLGDVLWKKWWKQLDRVQAELVKQGKAKAESQRKRLGEYD